MQCLSYLTSHCFLQIAKNIHPYINSASILIHVQHVLALVQTIMHFKSNLKFPSEIMILLPTFISMIWDHWNIWTVSQKKELCRLLLWPTTIRLWDQSTKSFPLPKGTYNARILDADNKVGYNNWECLLRLRQTIARYLHFWFSA